MTAPAEMQDAWTDLRLDELRAYVIGKGATPTSPLVRDIDLIQHALKQRIIERDNSRTTLEEIRRILAAVVPDSAAQGCHALALAHDTAAALTASRERTQSLRQAVAKMREVAHDAFLAWDSDNDSRAGKLLAALDGSTGIRPDLDAVLSLLDGAKADG